MIILAVGVFGGVPPFKETPFHNGYPYGGSSRSLKTSDFSGAWPYHNIIFATQFCLTILIEHWFTNMVEPNLFKRTFHHLPANNPAPKTGWCKFLTCSDHLGSRMAIEAACECENHDIHQPEEGLLPIHEKSEKQSRGCSSPPFSK